MDVGDIVKFRMVPGDEAEVTIIGQIKQVDGDPPDAALVKEIHAASVWGTSDNAAGTMHSVALEDCQPWEPSCDTEHTTTP